MPASTQTALPVNIKLKSLTGRHDPQLTLSSIEVVSRPGELLVVDVRVDVHLPGVDLHDPGSRLLGGGGELDLPVQPAGPEQGGVEDVDPVGGRDDLGQSGDRVFNL